MLLDMIPASHVDSAAYRALGEVESPVPVADLNGIAGGVRFMVPGLAIAFHLVDVELPAVGPEDLPGHHETCLINRCQDGQIGLF